MSTKHFETRAGHDLRERLLAESRLFGANILAFPLFLWSRLRRPVALKLIGRVFVLVELYLLLRFFGIHSAAQIGAILAADSIIFEVIRSISEASMMQIRSIPGFVARRKAFYEGISVIIISSTLLTAFVASALICSGGFKDNCGLVAALTVLTPLRCFAKYITDMEALESRPQRGIALPLTLRILPSLGTICFAGVFGTSAFYVSYFVSRLILPLRTILLNRRLIFIRQSKRKVSSFIGFESKFTQRAKVHLLVSIPGAALQLSEMIVLSIISPVLLLMFLALTKLVNLSLFIHTRCALIPIRTLAGYSIGSSRPLYNQIMGRWQSRL